MVLQWRTQGEPPIPPNAPTTWSAFGELGAIGGPSGSLHKPEGDQHDGRGQNT